MGAGAINSLQAAPPAPALVSLLGIPIAAGLQFTCSVSMRHPQWHHRHVTNLPSRTTSPSRAASSDGEVWRSLSCDRTAVHALAHDLQLHMTPIHLHHHIVWSA
jgi:hypothetical protein